MPSNPAPIPLTAIVSDIVGTIVAAVGALEHFDILHVLPESWRFEFDTVILMLVGVIMTIPFIHHMIRRLTT